VLKVALYPESQVVPLGRQVEQPEPVPIAAR
jgi:hypothetical protein